MHPQDQAQRQPTQIPRGAGVEGVQVAVGVEPHDAGMDAGPLRPGQRRHRDQTVARDDRGRPALADVGGDLVGCGPVQGGQPTPDVAVRQRRIDQPEPIGDRQRDLTVTYQGECK
jgi:hypothetical protein